MSRNYVGDIYYHGIKQDGLAVKEISFEEEDSDIINLPEPVTLPEAVESSLHKLPLQRQFLDPWLFQKLPTYQ